MKAYRLRRAPRGEAGARPGLSGGAEQSREEQAGESRAEAGGRIGVKRLRPRPET
jgi:hypothetical protein